MKKHVFMFIDLPSAKSMSAYVNGAQFVSWFQSQGWKLTLLPPFPWKWLWHLANQKGFARLMWYGLLPVQRLYEVLFRVSKADLVIVHKSLVTMQKRPILEALLRRRHRAIIFNFDDAVYEKGIPYVAERIGLADAVWVGNPLLVEYSRKYCQRVALIESAVDCRHYTAKKTYDIHRPIHLIWSGNVFNHSRLEQLREPLRELAKRKPFVFKIISGVKFSFNDADIHDEWIPFNYETEVACLHDADIALMPLVDGPYERAKENYKVKMYMACGLPIICSPVGMNTHFIQEGQRGFFAETAEDWVKAIEQVADSTTLRESLGRNARQHAVCHYDIPVIGQQLLTLFEEVLG